MAESKFFDPILTSKHLDSSYREYLEATIHFDDPDLQEQLEGILDKPSFLSKGPFLEATPPYLASVTPRQLIGEGVLCEEITTLGGGDPKRFDPDRPLYRHQEEALRMAASGKNYIVVTGTGSGKTECFLLPILNDILREFSESGPADGVRALILYPMNALANDQLKRLRELLAGTDITFGRYTGETEQSEAKARAKWREEHGDEARLKNELISREVMRETPPNILLTNYSMLEYLMLRPADEKIFSSSFARSWRHLAIDEAHVYSGALGTEIAYLIRRLKARLAEQAGEAPHLHCYATSATIGSEDRYPDVAKFAEDLFGEPFAHEKEDYAVITGKREKPADDLAADPWGTLSLGAWKELRPLLSDPAHAEWPRLREALAAGGAPDGVLAEAEAHAAPLLRLGSVLLGEGNVARLVRREADGGRSLFDLTDLGSMGELGIEGLAGDIESAETLSAMVEVLAVAQRREGVPILASRYHTFLRAPEGLFINLRSMRLIDEKRYSQEDEGDGTETPVYEVSVCRHCGSGYILGSIEHDEDDIPWLDPRHSGSDAGDEFLPRTYYRLQRGEDLVDIDDTVETFWLCPACGSLSSEKGGGKHRFAHADCERIPIEFAKSEERQANEDVARCLHCGYSNRYAIQPMRVSPEAAGSVVCYDLVREVPSFKKKSAPRKGFGARRRERDARKDAGSVICFSDRRQDAAFFAPAMERTYNAITRRQIIFQAVEEKCSQRESCSPADVVDWIVQHRGQCNLHDSNVPSTDIGWEDLARQWVLDELQAEDRRNSLEGLCVVRTSLTPLRRLIEGDGVFADDYSAEIESRVSALHDAGVGWIDGDGLRELLLVSLDSLRQRSALLRRGERKSPYSNNRAGCRLVVSGDDSGVEERHINFVGKAPNALDGFIARYAARKAGVDLEGQGGMRAFLPQSKAVLRELFGMLNDMMPALLEEFQLDERDYINGFGFYLPMEFWDLRPARDDDEVYVCDRCGAELQHGWGDTCTTRNCDGHLRRMTCAEARSKDRFYKDIYHGASVPLRICEHTAQLSSAEAREIQEDFIRGDVNVLSCTTTFELGVDVGDLRSVFMRNVPPSPANYAQRAGRTGRRAGMPGFAVTFARLRPHDVEYYRHPSDIIKGDTAAPACYLDNTDIALRHVFAIAVSEFFRSSDERRAYAGRFNDFLDLSSDDPNGLEELRAYLKSRPKGIRDQLDAVLPATIRDADVIGLDGWSWVDQLVGEGGRLANEFRLMRRDYKHLDETIQGNKPSAKAALYNRMTLLDRDTIGVLAESGVLPKYGFPTDVVNLRLDDEGSSAAGRTLDLSRGLRQAIREYAPGSEVVAGMRLWKSTGIKKMAGRELPTYSYGFCGSDGTFCWGLDDGSDSVECPVCHKKVRTTDRMLEPKFGFVGKQAAKRPGEKRPRYQGSTEVHFGQDWGDNVERESIKLPGGSLVVKYATNGRLCVLNRGPAKKGFQYCMQCGGAKPVSEKSVARGGKRAPASPIEHEAWCKSKASAYLSALCSVFRSDVLELTPRFATHRELAEEDWRSAMWAICTSAAIMLDIPEAEIGATTYISRETNDYAILLYDDVPGGAGRVKQLAGMVPELLGKAYERVASCTCGEESCCYGCIANYYNQAEQSKLTRGGAMRVIGALLQGDAGTMFEPNDVDIAYRYGEGFIEEDIAKLAAGIGLSEEMGNRLAGIANACITEGLEIPVGDVLFCRRGEGRSEDYSAVLAWERAKVAILAPGEAERLSSGYQGVAGWRVVPFEDATPELVTDMIGGD